MITSDPFTGDDLARLPASDGKRYELVRGQIVERLATPPAHSETVGYLESLVKGWNWVHQAGQVASGAGYTLERYPDTVRRPDVGLVSQRHAARRRPTCGGFPQVVPDFVAEVRAPGESWALMARRMAHYLEVGVRLGWLVEIGQFVEVYRPGRPPQRYSTDDELRGEDVLPGFSCRVRALFPGEWSDDDEEA